MLEADIQLTLDFDINPIFTFNQNLMSVQHLSDVTLMFSGCWAQVISLMILRENQQNPMEWV